MVFGDYYVIFYLGKVFSFIYTKCMLPVSGSYDRSTNPTIMVSATRNPISDENEAAAKIQAGFRGYKVRRDLKDSSRSDNTCSTSSSSEPLSIEDKSAAKIQAGVRGYLVRKRKNEEKKAATKIQAGFRGYKTRKELKSPSSDEGRSLC
jgi:Myosin heavy chain